MATATSAVEDHSSFRYRLDSLPEDISRDLDVVQDLALEAKRKADQMITRINNTLAAITKARSRVNEVYLGVGSDIEKMGELQEIGRRVQAMISDACFEDYKDMHPPDDADDDRPNNLGPIVQANEGILAVHKSGADSTAGVHPTTAEEEKEWKLSFISLHSLPRSLLRWLLNFPEDSIFKKSLLLLSKFSSDSGGFNDTIDDLVLKGFIQPVYKSYRPDPYAYRMPPFVRSVLRLYLIMPLRRDTIYIAHGIDEDDIVYEGIAEFAGKKDLEFLHLGKWHESPNLRIEVDDPNLFFKDIHKNMPLLTYISLRGVSMISELPAPIIKLNKLQILDLKSCHNLEVLPSNIGRLKNSLTSLDISECYFLNHMPAALSKLVNLRVLKGFVVGEYEDTKAACALQDLTSLKVLVKLSIYASAKVFPSDDQLSSLEKLKALRNLTICWAGWSGSGGGEDGKEAIQVVRPTPPQRWFSITKVKRFSFKLEKLDLQSAPQNLAHSWLKPCNFMELKKLYIQGGQFNDLVRIPENHEDRKQENCWSVEMLRLKSLIQLQMDWSEFQDLFPKLLRLEKENCPNLTSFPCEEITDLPRK